ncbi:hypothetical protein TNCV_4073651 [Trichonephila clavipes]|uniref:Uncharacterized protein n=1 Tax=Trichonephila clavipes TaxID=2585209 RepID=A0A8X6W820_TRICX|nr:hypothetical protein TNCV_4073651 [Trichonephila clavipes]
MLLNATETSERTRESDGPQNNPNKHSCLRRVDSAMRGKGQQGGIAGSNRKRKEQKKNFPSLIGWGEATEDKTNSPQQFDVFKAMGKGVTHSPRAMAPLPLLLPF